MTMHDSALDRPVWNALRSRLSACAVGHDRALRMAPSYGPFAAAVSNAPEDIASLAALPCDANGLYIVETEAVEAPLGMTIAASAPCCQMIADSIGRADHDFEVSVLTDAEAPEMIALATLTRPGPFSTATHRLGRFIGIRWQGQLVAMAGERMKLEGFVEVSGVCTHPDHRGRGYAHALMHLVAGRILERREMPFLHAYEVNESAIALYEALGFRIRRRVILTILKPSELSEKRVRKSRVRAS